MVNSMPRLQMCALGRLCGPRCSTRLILACNVSINVCRIVFPTCGFPCLSAPGQVPEHIYISMLSWGLPSQAANTRGYPETPAMASSRSLGSGGQISRLDLAELPFHGAFLSPLWSLLAGPLSARRGLPRLLVD